MGEAAIVITCRDAGRTLREAVDSASAQTRPAAEVVVVDDGSTDAYTQQMLSGLRLPSLSIVRSASRGAAAARNHGISLTTAPYVIVLQAEDRLDAGFLATAAGRLDSSDDVDFVITGARAFEGSDWVWTPGPCTLMEALARGLGHPSILFRRRVWEAVGGYDEAASVCLDEDFWMAALAMGFRGEVVEEPLVAYRVRADSDYHDALVRGETAGMMAALYEKHRAAVEAAGPELVERKQAFLVELEAHGRHLEHRRAVLEAEQAALEERIGDAVRQLRQRGEEVVDWGELRRLTPISSVWGLDRGRPLDRYYIEGFLDRHRNDVRGHVLEVKDAWYTKLFGGAQVVRSDVLDIDASNPEATVLADLARADSIPSETFDCFILTQTLHLIYDVRGALAHACRILKPGGVLLGTAPCVSRISYEDGGRDHDYWRFTEASLRELFLELFPPDGFELTTFGNVLACAAFLYGLPPDELRREELDATDPWFPLLFAVRAVRPARLGR